MCYKCYSKGLLCSIKVIEATQFDVRHRANCTNLLSLLKRYMAVIQVISLFLCACCPLATQLSFDLEDSEFNQVVFVGETDILMRCSDPSTTENSGANCSMKIQDQKKKVISESNQCQNYLEYKIQKVSFSDGGLYTCIVSFVINTGHTLAWRQENRTLYLNVHNGGPQCLDNGQPYRIGDMLVMSCYCWPTESCEWVKHVGGKRWKVVDNSKIIRHHEKTIQRVRSEITPFNGSTNVTFVCESQASIGNESRSSVIINKSKSSCEVPVLTSISNRSFITSTSKGQNLSATKLPCGSYCENDVPEISPTMELHPLMEMVSLVGSLVKDQLVMFILVISIVLLLFIFVAVTAFFLRERRSLKTKVQEMSRSLENVYFSNDERIYSQILEASPRQNESPHRETDINVCCSSSFRELDEIHHVYEIRQ
ncbi:hypothetical protein HOLleu_28023 [Holothuria leucospilota]|uniref:Uncharacterized protein n=1 Tax=Holothuria leucospilota TaxID=206669 RepID=A0A9Q1BR73_HOLLE|nr:hypothetical protein HOLleu_28023 [Holothuria leucospilota]